MNLTPAQRAYCYQLATAAQAAREHASYEASLEFLHAEMAYHLTLVKFTITKGT